LRKRNNCQPVHLILHRENGKITGLKKGSNNEQMSGEIVKMAKEIATLKRQLV
jgi:hypothetical protein